MATFFANLKLFINPARTEQYIASKCEGGSDLFGKARRCVDISGVLEEVVGLHVD